ncbi:hypothetical protein [Veillonella sp. 3891]|uniref:hypothetical protein n=1 Tax=Veillonella sp. 3891 TaxID=2490951 RepID=UPI0013E0715D|nr:hypothetical protein [Veillonella sp. 3891]
MTLGKIVIDEDMLERVMRKVMQEIVGEMRVAGVTKSSPTVEKKLRTNEEESTADKIGSSHATGLEQSDEISMEEQANEVESIRRELHELQEKNATMQENYNELRNMFRSIHKEKKEWEERYHKLKDDNVRVHEEQKEIHEYVNSLLAQYGIKGEENMGLLDMIRRFFNCQNDVLQKTVKESSQQISDLNYEISQLKTNIANTTEELNHWKEKAVDNEEKCKSLEADCQQLKKDKGELETTCKNYKKENKALQEKLKLSFEKGQELFVAIQALPESYTDYIRAEVQLNNLESFIISSTMSQRVLERIWESAKEAAVSEDTASFKVLWSYFEYACDLFNKGRGNEIIVIDTVEVGATYNVHDHDAVSGSASRGDIQKIYIKGFKNSYSEERVRKSCVRV